MEKDRKGLIENVLKEMFLAFRSLKHPYEHSERKGKKGFGLANKLGQGFFGQRFSHGHRDLFFCLMQEKEGISVKDIAETMKVTPGAITQMVDKLVEWGVVTREEDPDDRRSQKIKLSNKAREKVERLRKVLCENLEPKFTTLTDNEIVQLTNLLAKINSKEANND